MTGLLRWVRRYLPLLLAGAILAAAVVLGARGSGPLARYGWVRRLGGRADPVVAAPADARSMPSTGDTTDDTAYTLGGVAYDAGECVTWSQTLNTYERSTMPVACDQPHLFEVVQRFEQDGVGFDLSGPTREQWRVIADQTCGPMIETYLGYPVDPHGRFAPGLIQPTADGWAAGQRTVWCGLQATDGSDDTDGHLVEFSDGARGADQTLLYGVGACFAASADGSFGSTAPCSGPHVAEVTGTVDVSSFLSSFPDAEGYPQEVADRCRQLAEERYGGPLAADVEGNWFLIDQSSWDAGRRVVECTLVRHDPGGDLVPVTGPLRSG